MHDLWLLGHTPINPSPDTILQMQRKHTRNGVLGCLLTAYRRLWQFLLHSALAEHHPKSIIKTPLCTENEMRCNILSKIDLICDASPSAHRCTKRKHCDIATMLYLKESRLNVYIITFSATDEIALMHLLTPIFLSHNSFAREWLAAFPPVLALASLGPTHPHPLGSMDNGRRARGIAYA